MQQCNETLLEVIGEDEIFFYFGLEFRYGFGTESEAQNFEVSNAIPRNVIERDKVFFRGIFGTKKKCFFSIFPFKHR
jgi:hypothetical protein